MAPSWAEMVPILSQDARRRLLKRLESVKRLLKMGIHSKALIPALEKSETEIQRFTLLAAAWLLPDCYLAAAWLLPG